MTRFADFSDDGVKFFGAYGPKIVDQLPYVVKKLDSDLTSRQAGLTIWRENPPDTKDYPCTIAIFFRVLHGLLNVHVFMRSSDLWLGVPYDVFNFSMLGHYVCGHLNRLKADRDDTMPGKLYLTAASSHLYEPQWEAAHACVSAKSLWQPGTPTFMWLDPNSCLKALKQLRDSQSGDLGRWWERNT
jgi:thymidylate synthase